MVVEPDLERMVVCNAVILRGAVGVSIDRAPADKRTRVVRRNQASVQAGIKLEAARRNSLAGLKTSGIGYARRRYGKWEIAIDLSWNVAGVAADISHAQHAILSNLTL